MRNSKSKPNPLKRLGIVAAVIVAIPCLYLIGAFLTFTISSIFADVRNAPYRVQVAHALEDAKQRRDQISSQLSGALLVKDDVTDCEYGLLGRLGSLDCQGTAYAVFGTNQPEAGLKRELLDKLHALGYTADWTLGPSINSITSYPDGKFVGSISWDSEATQKIVYCSQGFGSSCKSKPITLPTLNNYARYYVLRIDIPMRTQEKQAQIDNDLRGRKDPRSFPPIDYPPTAREGFYSHFDQSTNEISFNEYLPARPVTLPLCADFKVVDEENFTLPLVAVKTGSSAAFYTSGSCVAIMGVNLRRTE